MVDKKSLNKMLFIGFILIFISCAVDFFNLAPMIPGIYSFNNSIITIILWSLLSIMKIGVCIYTLVLFIKAKDLDIINVAPCILVIHITNMLIDGGNLFFLMSSIYFTITICFIIKYKNNS